MSNPAEGGKLREPEEEQPDNSSGVNLKLIYGLLLLGLLVAMGFAVLIVLPFYHRR